MDTRACNVNVKGVGDKTQSFSFVTDPFNYRKGNYGFNAQTGEYGDMIEMGVLDPTKVVRVALQNAASIAGLMITIVAMINEAPKKETLVPPGMEENGWILMIKKATRGPPIGGT